MRSSSEGDDPALERTAASGVGPAADLDTLEVAAGATVAAPPDALPEVAAGRYELGAEVGRGGLGRVMRARDRVMQRGVAIKELLGSDDGARRRFVREALITARLQHPSIVPVYDAARWKDRAPFYAMKLVAGRPLSDAIAEARTLDARLALVPTVLAVADAIAYAHGQRVIHRDLKPGNVLVGEFGETVVIDWGLAKDLAIDDRDALDAGPYRDAPADQTAAGVVLGTPAYMAPEQAAGGDVDERADVYAIGAMLYHLIGGAIPHQGKTLDQVIRRVLAGEITPLPTREPRTPTDLATVVAKAMARDPAARYPTAKELADDLRRFQTGQLVAAHRYTLGERIRRWVRLHRGTAATLAVAVVAGAIGATWFLVREHGLRQKAEEQRDRAQRAQAQVYLERADAAYEAHDLARQTLFLAHAHALDPAVVQAAVVEDLADRTSRRSWLVSLDAPATAMALADPHRVLVGANDGVVVEVDAASGAEIRRFDTKRGPVLAVAVSPDGARLATGSIDGFVQIWDRSAERLAHAWLAHGRRVTSLRFAADGETLYSASDDLTAAAWSPADGRNRSRLTGHAGGVNGLALSADGRLLATVSDDGSARLWAIEDGAPTATIVGHEEDVARVVFTPDGSRVLTAGGDATIRVSEIASGRTLQVFRGHAASVTALALTPDGKTVFSASADQTIRVWDLASGEERYRLTGHAAWITELVPILDGAAVIACDRDGRVARWTIPLDADARELPPLDQKVVRRAAFAADGRSAATVGDDLMIRRWRIPEGTLLDEWKGHDGPITAVAFFDGDRALLTASHDEQVKTWDLATHTETARLPGHTSLIWGAAIDPSGARALSGGSDRDLRLWDLATGTPEVLVGHTDTVNAVRFSADGRLAATSGNDRAAILWDVASRRPLRRFDGHAGQVASVALAPDGHHLATAAWDDRVHVWDLDAQAPSTDLDCGAAGCDVIAYSPDGRLLVGGGIDGTLRIWDAASGAELRRIPAHIGRVYGLAVAPDGRHILTGGSNGRVRLWSLDLSSVSASAARRDLVEHVEASTGLSLVDGRVVVLAAP